MAHRGRLNVMAHVLNKPYAQILAEFKDPVSRNFREDMAWTGDVKYHAGAHRAIKGGAAMDLVVSMPPNPSHLEAVDPVVEGMARAAGTSVDSAGAPRFDPARSVPILIHGDAAFPGQGIVAETLNLSRLPGYTTGGTIHIIVNNQLGFTTGPGDVYSTSYASGLARGFKIPIVHVNADDPEACVEAARLAIAYRERFQRDFLIDLIGYRRYGHNEGDEPAFTQPLMYQKIASHPTVARVWARTLVARGVVTSDKADAIYQARSADMQAASRRSRPEQDFVEPQPEAPPPGAAAKADTTVPLERLARAERVARWRCRPTSRRTGSSSAGARSGRTCSRATTSGRSTGRRPRSWRWRRSSPTASASASPARTSSAARSATATRSFTTSTTGRAHVPLQTLPQARAAFEIHNSPLTENAVARLRVRLQHPGAVAARDLGSAVRRLHQRRAGHHRRVPRVGARQVGAAAVARAAAAARARGPGPGPRERAAGALPAARRRHQHAHRQLHDRGAVLPPAAAAGGAAPGRSAAARRADAEEPAAPPDGRLDAARARRGTLPHGDPRRTRPSPAPPTSGASSSAAARSTSI